MTHVRREWFVAMCIVVPMTNAGVMYAFPACLLPGVNRDSNITRDDAVWAGTSFAISGVLSFAIIPPIMQRYGRKVSHIFTNTSLVIGSIVVALSQNLTVMIIGRCIQGIAFSNVVIATILIGEYCHPKRRGAVAVLKVLAICIGISLVHGISLTMTWRQLAWLTVLPSAFSALLTFTWPESPSWLAYKGRFDECADAFEWLRGNNEETKREAKELIMAQQVIQETVRKHNAFGRFTKAMSTKHFLKPICVLLVAAILNHACGLAYLVSYIIEIMLEMSGGDRSQAFYFTMAFDFMKIFAVVMSIFLIKSFDRRTTLFYGGFISAMLLFSVCLIQYLFHLNVHNITWLAPLALTVYDLFCCATIMPIVLLLKGELIPLEYRGLGMTLIGVVESIVMGAITKLTATLLDSIKVYGTFMLYLVVIVACLIILYYTLPETKDRTLQDIESEFTNIKFDECHTKCDEHTTMSKNNVNV